jgi:2-hydroxy-6-oxonona-2,4-dienedioate hydrolase
MCHSPTMLSALERLVRSRHLRSDYRRVAGITMHARIGDCAAAASTLPIVLIHGQVVSSRYMEPLAEILASTSAVYVPDLPGFGLSEKPRDTLDIQQLSDALAAWLEAMALPPALIMGNSLGCQIAARLAAQHAAHVRKVVLLGPTIDPHARSAARQTVRWLRSCAYERPSLVLPMTLDFLSAGPRRFLQTFRFVLHDQIERYLPQISAPTLIVRGSHDAIVPQRWAEEATAMLPRGRLVVIPGASHSPNFSAPGAMAAVILEFLRAG